jgi:hypothetical protein
LFVCTVLYTSISYYPCHLLLAHSSLSLSDQTVFVLLHSPFYLITFLDSF